MKFLRKISALILVMVVTILALPAMASPGEVLVTVDGTPVVFEGQGPIITGNRTLVPVRGVFEVLGFYPVWDSASRTATLTRDDYVVVLTIGQYIFTTNGVEYVLDVPAQIIGDRTLLPLRAVLESVGYRDMDWVSATRHVIIRTGAVDVPTSTPMPSPTPTPGVPQTLVGSWYWRGSMYYMFNADGTGIAGGVNIRWWTYAGVLNVCITPELCLGPCPSPVQWYYSLGGDGLTVVNRRMPDLRFVYYR